ncbi:MAG: AbrB/MazE/SpoVT family DNA-binding domain-containing protein [Deltaproteobacteria bacterium]|jgi:antitoxin MazE|nr:AbrB/MazE/SpoVT family DNA-binding domain-containing protein [Deltaproteobacteria bacterium]MBW2582670.1 AbrB/MazE/SpoVT family DNA-binding domain-containing protein [Deltaproteobacteria bacterium]
MRARIIKIGNSQGIRIPKPLLEQLKIKEDVDIEVEKNQIIVRPVSNPRIGWDNAFRKMAENDDDILIDGEQTLTQTWDETEWQW